MNSRNLQSERQNYFRLMVGTLGILMTIFAVRAANLPFKSYTTSEGLAHDRVSRIVRDKRGFLWFCTSEGLSRFDGYEFNNYTRDDGLPHRAVFDFLETKTGEFWIATDDGLVLFDPAGVSKRRQTPGDSSVSPMFRTFRPDNLKTAQKTWGVSKLLEDRDGRIWAASENGLFEVVKESDWHLKYFEIRNDEQKPIEDLITLIQDRTGAFWAGTGAGLYRILPDARVQTISRKMNVLSLLEDKTGRVWVGSSGGDKETTGLHLFANDGDAPSETQVFRKRDGLSDDFWMNALIETADGRIFVGVGNGLCEYAPQTGANEPQFQILSNDGVVALGEDTSGNLWFSTNSSGVKRLARHGFINFDESDNLPSKTVSSIISSSDGETYVLTRGNEIQRFNGQKFDSVAPKEIINFSWGSGQVSFRDHMGAWWIAGTNGLQRYPPVGRLEDLARVKPLKTYTTRDGLYVNLIFRLFEDSRGDIWISTLGESPASLMRWDRATDTIRGFADEDGVPVKNAPTAFGEDAGGNVWIGFYGGGLIRYHNGKFDSFNAADNLPAGYIHRIFSDSRGRVWVATSANGVVRIDEPASEEKPHLANLTTHDGLSSSQATCVTEDDFGRIYIGTGRGVNRLDLQTGRIKLFTKADGLPENIVTQCRKDSSGALWFGTANGLARYLPSADEQSELPPIFLSGLRVNGEPVRKLSELGETNVAELNFASDQRQLQIDFFALGFGTGETLRYQYKLDGADWSEPTAQRNVNLNLSPGVYNFLVRAVNADGAASENPASLSFSIARPVWQRWWFLILAALIVTFIIYSLYSYRLRRLLELERVRTRIATDLHDDIGSSLSQIAILSEVVRQKVGGNGAAEPLNLIADTSREMVDSMSDIVWAINPNKDHLADLVQRMRRFASDILDATEIAYKFQADEKHRQLALGADVRREVYLMFKECVNNLVKYADASAVEMSAQIENKLLVVKINDNGAGFNVDEKTVDNQDNFGGNGLPNMRRRAANLGGQFEIESQIGAGTSVTIKIPVREKTSFLSTT